MNSEAAQILDRLRRLLQALRETAREAETRLKISGAQLFVLQTVGQSPGLSLSELAERTYTHQSSVSVVVARLVKAGYLTRTRSTNDGRRAELALTTRGTALLARAPEAAQHALIDAIEALPSAQRAALSRALDTITTSMALQHGEPAMFFEGRRRTAARAREPRHE